MLRQKISQHWETIQHNLFPWLEEELPPLSEKQQQLVSILELIRIEQYVRSSYAPGTQGRPEKSRSCIARAFIAKSVYNLPTTTALLERLHSDISLRRICGWENRGQIPSESVFSRAFAEFAVTDLPGRVHEALIKYMYDGEIVGHVITDSSAMPAREKSAKKKKLVETTPVETTPKIKKTRRKKGEVSLKEPTRLEKQISGKMSLIEMINDLPKYCDAGCKTNSKGNKYYWVGYKLHITVDDNGVPLAGITTTASLNDTQAAIPLAKLTAQRVLNLYDVMDAGYHSDIIDEHSRSLGHVPLIARQSKRDGEKEEKALEKLARETLNWKYPEEIRYEIRTTVERTISRLKDEFGLVFVRVRGAVKVAAHLMFGVLAMAADQLLKICQH
jgi:hypothetical protein